MIRIFDRNRIFVDEIESFESVSISRKYRGIDTITIKFNAKNLPIDYLVKGNYVMMNNQRDRFFRIYHIHYEIKENLVTGEVIGYEILQFLKQRITIPPVNEAYHKVRNETVRIISEYITTNMLDALDEDRNIPFIKLKNPDVESSTISDQTRYKKLYEEVIRLMHVDNLGVKTNYQHSNEIEIEFYKGNNRAIGNSKFAPVIFSMKYENIIEGDFFDSSIENKTFVYAGGCGKGSERMIRSAFLPEDIGEERYEVFKDARNIKDEVSLVEKGHELIHKEKESLDVEIDPFGNFIYQEDFYLGDIVSIELLSLKFDAQIIEVHEIYEENQMKLICSLGNPIKTIIDVINDQQAQASEIILE